MPIVKFIDANNEMNEVEIEANESVMTLAVNNMIEGIEAECGGVLACATCHCYVDDKYSQYFNPADEMEEAMLEMVQERKPTSRLSCQLTLTAETPDIEINLPESQ